MKHVALLAAVLAVAVSGRAGAMTSEGTLITNVAAASFWAADGNKFIVTYGGSSNVLVMNPTVQLRKVSTPSMQCSGGTVTFCIYVINVSAMSSAFNITIEDIMPGNGAGMGFAFLDRTTAPFTERTEWNPQGATVVYGYRPTNIGANNWWVGTAGDPELDGEPADGTPGPYYIRWNVSLLGPNRSMMVCFKASVF